MHDMQIIAIDDPGRLSVTLSVRHAVSRMRLRCAKRLEVLLGVEILWDPRNIVLYTSPGSQPRIRCGVHQITLATSKPVVCYPIFMRIESCLKLSLCI